MLFILNLIDSQGFFPTIGLPKRGFELVFISLVNGYIKGTKVSQL